MLSKSEKCQLRNPTKASDGKLQAYHTYFTVTIKVKDQMISESAPKRSCRSGSEEKVDEKT